jgi:hypothetical protein
LLFALNHLFEYSLYFIHYAAEAMLVDWVGVNGVDKGAIYIILKGSCCGEVVGQLPVSFHKNLALAGESEVYGMLPLMIDPSTQGIFTCRNNPFRVWQRADMCQDRKLIAMITGASPPRVYFYPRLQGQTILEAFTSVPVPTNCPYILSVSYGILNEMKHEAVAFADTEATRFADTSECEGGSTCNVPIYFYDLIYPDTVDLSPQESADDWIEITNDDFEDGGHVGSYVLGVSMPLPAKTMSVAAVGRFVSVVTMDWLPCLLTMGIRIAPAILCFVWILSFKWTVSTIWIHSL